MTPRPTVGKPSDSCKSSRPKPQSVPSDRGCSGLHVWDALTTVKRSTLSLKASECDERLLPLLLGRVFHVTSQHAFAEILASGQIHPNVNGTYTSPFGSSNSYFRKRGCVGLFDYRAATPEQIEASISKCSPYPACECDGRLAFLFLSERAQSISHIRCRYSTAA